MMIRICVAVAALVTFASAGAAADTADQCSTRCERNAISDRQVCADLPANPSCRPVVEKNRLRCLDFCDRAFPHVPARPGPPANGSKVEARPLLHSVSDRQ